MRVLLIDKRPALVAVLVWLVAGVLLALSANQPADASTPRAGRYCAAKELGQQRAGYVCAWKGSHRRWQRQAQATTPPARAVAPTATVTRVVTKSVPGPTVTVTETTHVECTPSSPTTTGTPTTTTVEPARLVVLPLRITRTGPGTYGHWLIWFTWHGTSPVVTAAEVKVDGRLKGRTTWEPLFAAGGMSSPTTLVPGQVMTFLYDDGHTPASYDALRLTYKSYTAEIGL